MSRHHRKPVSRRAFIRSTAASSSVVALGVWCGSQNVSAAPAQLDKEPKLTERIFKTLKINMVKVKAPLSERFAAARTAGFAGI